VVEDDQAGIHGLAQLRELLHFALADKSGGFGRVAGLDNAAGDDGARAGGQLRQFFEGIRGVRGSKVRTGAAALPIHPNQDRPFGRRL
jgi:hypothetical protein